MSEITRRIRLTFLIIEMIMMIGVPAPRRLARACERFNTWRWERQRTRSLPQKTRGYEQLLRRNPGLIPSPALRKIATR